MGILSGRLVNKKAQATVEFLLLIVVLVPILSFAISAINKRVFGTLQGWIGTEIQARARYGYSYKYYVDKGSITASQLNATSGQPAITYEANVDSSHPMARVKEGWTQ